MKYIVTINDNNYEVEVEQGEASIVKTEKSAVQLEATSTVKANETAKPVVEMPKVKVSDGEKITAPMPGTILKITKNSGDKVNKGDIILILEAMKMENEILAPRDGVIVQITAVKGSNVNTGDILAVIC